MTFASGRTAGDIISIISFRATNTAGTTSYAVFTRNTVQVTNQSSITPPFSITDGFEFLFMNGTVLSTNDYNMGINNTGEVSILDLPGPLTGLMTIIQWTTNNIQTQTGVPHTSEKFTVQGLTTYSLDYTSNSLVLYENGLLLTKGTDYSELSGGYNLATTPVRSSDCLTQQTFSRTGAA